MTWLKTRILLIVLAILSGCSLTTESRSAKNGVLDLRGVDLLSNVVSLDGDWQFIWQSDTLYVMQPGSWTSTQWHGKYLQMEGAGTYSLDILLDSIPRNQLILSTKEINSESQIWLNGTRLPDLGHNRLYQRLDFSGKELQIKIHVSNRFDVSPGISCPVYLGRASMIEDRAEFYLSVQVFLLGMFAVFFFLYFVSWCLRREDLSSLLLSIHALSWGCYTFFQGQEASPAEIIFPWISVSFEQKAYLLAGAFSFPSFALSLTPMAQGQNNWNLFFGKALSIILL